MQSVQIEQLETWPIFNRKLKTMIYLYSNRALHIIGFLYMYAAISYLSLCVWKLWYRAVKEYV